MLSFNYINFPREVNENVLNNCKKIVSFSFLFLVEFNLVNCLEMEKNK